MGPGTGSLVDYMAGRTRVDILLVAIEGLYLLGVWSAQGAQPTGQTMWTAAPGRDNLRLASWCSSLHSSRRST